ncbi:hypothetical protein JKP88DRAFT_309481, partial [Tribonema minus]
AIVCSANWSTTRVKYDPYHWQVFASCFVLMANFFLMAHSKESSLFKYFCTSMSEALFQLLPGERERVAAHLRTLDPTMTDERLKRVPRAYWRRYCRYTIPPPTVLYHRVQAVYTFFSMLNDPAAPTQRPFFTSKHAKIFDNSMGYIKQGLLSDPPHMDMYARVRTLQTGLVVYRSLRSTSPLEGYHLHLRQALVAGAVASGPRWLESVTNTFDFRWCVKALLRAGALPAWVKHYDLELYDVIFDVVKTLYGDGHQVLRGHQRTQQQPVVVRHGMHFVLEHQR